MVEEVEEGGKEYSKVGYAGLFFLASLPQSCSAVHSKGVWARSRSRRSRSRFPFLIAHCPVELGIAEKWGGIGCTALQAA